MDGELLRNTLEATVAMVLLGLLVAALYALFMGGVPWTFFVGEVMGLGLGIGLLAVAGPRRPRR